MRDCRWSRGLLLLATFIYACAAGTSFEFESMLPPAGRPLVIQGLLLVGHIGLILSMWCMPDMWCTAPPIGHPSEIHLANSPASLPVVTFSVAAVWSEAPDTASQEKAHARRTVASELRDRNGRTAAAAEPAADHATVKPTSGICEKAAIRFRRRHENSPVRTERVAFSPATEVPAERAQLVCREQASPAEAAWLRCNAGADQSRPNSKRSRTGAS